MGKNKDGANRTKGNVKVRKYDVSLFIYSLLNSNKFNIHNVSFVNFSLQAVLGQQIC